MESYKMKKLFTLLLLLNTCALYSAESMNQDELEQSQNEQLIENSSNDNALPDNQNEEECPVCMIQYPKKDLVAFWHADIPNGLTETSRINGQKHYTCAPCMQTIIEQTPVTEYLSCPICRINAHATWNESRIIFKNAIDTNIHPIEQLETILNNTQLAPALKTFINITNTLGYSLFAQAVWHNNVSLAKLLITKEGIDINQQNGHKTYPLIQAFQHKSPEMISLLLKHDVAFKIANVEDLTIIGLAAYHNELEIMSLLLDHNIPIDFPGAIDTQATALTLAAQKNHLDMITYLCNNGADVNLLNIHKDSPLIWATYRNNERAVEILLNKNARVDIVNKCQETALSLAFLQNNQTIISMLIAHRASIKQAIKQLTIMPENHNFKKEQIQQALNNACIYNTGISH